MKKEIIKMGTTHCFIQRLTELIARFSTRQAEQMENYDIGLLTFTDHVIWMRQLGDEYLVELDAIVRQAMSDLQVSKDYLKGAAHSHSMSLCDIK